MAMLKPKLPGLNYFKEIREMVTEKRKTRRRWQQTRSPEDKRLLNKLYGQLKQVIHEVKMFIASY